jgi:hypothetical protein
MDYGFTVAVQQNPTGEALGNQNGHTASGKRSVPRHRDARTMANTNPREVPMVSDSSDIIILGFLVCNKCAVFGHDIAIVKPETHIGSEMDIDTGILGNTDETLHLVINYDSYANLFYLYQLSGQYPVLLNGVPVAGRVMLSDFDRIDVAGGQFIIVRNP